MPKLYAHCTVEMFNTIKATKGHSKNGKMLIIDARNHTVALNDNGTCTVEQFGSLEIAKNKFNEMRSTL